MKLANLLKPVEKVVLNDYKTKDETITDYINFNNESIRLNLNTNGLSQKIEANVIGRSIDLRYKSWIDNKKLPKGYINIKSIQGDFPDNLTYLNEFKTVRTPDIIDIANKLNMIVVPIEYVDDKHMFDADENCEDLKEKYKIFKELINIKKNSIYENYCKEPIQIKHDMYLLCPISYYSVLQHIKSDCNKDIYYPKSLESTFDILTMLIPTLSTMYNITQNNSANIKTLFNNQEMINKKINNVVKSVTDLEYETMKKFENFNTVIENINSEIKRIEEKVDNKIKEIELKKQKEIDELTAKKEKEKKLTEIRNKYDNEIKLERENIQKMIEQFRSLNHDPLLFAISSEHKITDDVTAILGLCWGTELNDIYVHLKGLSKKFNEDINEIYNTLNIY